MDYFLFDFSGVQVHYTMSLNLIFDDTSELVRHKLHRLFYAALAEISADKRNFFSIRGCFLLMSNK